MRQRRYLQNLVNSTHSSMHAEYKMKSRQKWMWRERWREEGSRKRQGHKQIDCETHFFVVFDFIFRDDAIGLLGLLPGELDAALLHLLLDDLADLGRSCLDKNMSISWGQTNSARTRIKPATNQLHHSSSNTQRPWSKCLHLLIEISIALQTAEDSVTAAGGELQHVDYEWQFSSIHSNISSGTSRHLLCLLSELLRDPLRGRGVYLWPCDTSLMHTNYL